MIIAISDLHIGYKKSEVKKFKEFIEKFLTAYPTNSTFGAMREAQVASEISRHWMLLGFQGMTPEELGRFLEKHFAQYVKKGQAAFQNKAYTKALGQFENAIQIASEQEKYRKYLLTLYQYSREAAYQSGSLEKAFFYAENFVDGVLSPLCFAAIGGAPLAMAYKMINTLDSMVGYKNVRYHQFGWAAARIDDLANFIPARLSVPIISLAVRILAAHNAKRALSTAIKEGAQHGSPNAGYPEAAFAGALAIKLNGPNTYGGVLVDKPYIGVAFGDVTVQHIPKACVLMMLSAVISTALAWLVSLGWGQ